MGKTANNAILVAATIIALMILFPPFCRNISNGRVINEGYSFVLAPPSRGANVNKGMLFIQIFGVALIGGGCWFALRNKCDSNE